MRHLRTPSKATAEGRETRRYGAWARTRYWGAGNTTPPRNALDVCGFGDADLGGSLLRANLVDADLGQLRREAVRLGITA